MNNVNNVISIPHSTGSIQAEISANHSSKFDYIIIWRYYFAYRVLGIYSTFSCRSKYWRSN